MLKRNIQLIILLFSCAAMTLGLSGGQLAKLKPFSANKIADARKPDAPGKTSLPEFLNTPRSPRPKSYSRLFAPTPPVHTCTLPPTAGNLHHYSNRRHLHRQERSGHGSQQQRHERLFSAR